MRLNKKFSGNKTLSLIANSEITTPDFKRNIFLFEYIILQYFDVQCTVYWKILLKRFGVSTVKKKFLKPRIHSLGRSLHVKPRPRKAEAGEF
jgi:hypothetical protein